MQSEGRQFLYIVTAAEYRMAQGRHWKITVIPGQSGRQVRDMGKLDYNKIGRRIRQVRKAKGWSQGTLAQKCGISMSFLGHIERGTRVMSMDTFAGICRALEVKADELLWGIPCPTEAGLSGMWDTSKSEKDADSYMMYTKIMKSVAEIMSEA